MPALFDPSVQDAALDKIATGTALHVCSGSPASRATVLSSSLATVALTGADFTKAANSPSGRKVTVAAKNGVPVTSTGTPASYCIIDGATLLARTEIDPATPGFTAGSTTDIPATSFAVLDPTVI